MNRRKLVTFLLALVPASLVRAHGGGLDSKGGHRDSKTGTYHYHRAPGGGAPAPAASSEVRTFRPPPPAAPGGRRFAMLPPHQQLEALVSALLAAGLVSQEALDRHAERLPDEP